MNRTKEPKKAKNTCQEHLYPGVVQFPLGRGKLLFPFARLPLAQLAPLVSRETLSLAKKYAPRPPPILPIVNHPSKSCLFLTALTPRVSQEAAECLVSLRPKVSNLLPASQICTRWRQRFVRQEASQAFPPQFMTPPSGNSMDLAPWR